MKRILEYLNVLAVGAKLVAAILQDDAEVDREAVTSLVAMLDTASDCINPRGTAIAGLQRLLSIAKKGA